MSIKQDSQGERAWWMRYYEQHCANLDVIPPKDLTNLLYLRGKSPAVAALLAKKLNDLPADQWAAALRGETIPATRPVSTSAPLNEEYSEQKPVEAGSKATCSIRGCKHPATVVITRQLTGGAEEQHWLCGGHTNPPSVLCPKCGAPAGEKCKNYKGQNKQSCPERGA